MFLINFGRFSFANSINFVFCTIWRKWVTQPFLCSRSVDLLTRLSQWTSTKMAFLSNYYSSTFWLIVKVTIKLHNILEKALEKYCCQNLFTHNDLLCLDYLFSFTCLYVASMNRDQAMCLLWIACICMEETTFTEMFHQKFLFLRTLGVSILQRLISFRRVCKLQKSYE